MKKIAIVGAGQAGLLMGFALLEKGWPVTIYTDRDAESILHGPIPNTAAMFESQLAYERSLGLNFWDDVAPRGEGLAIDFRDPAGTKMMGLAGHFGDHGAMSIDFRSKFHRWQTEFAQRGGNLVIGSLTPEDVGLIAEANDLTLVAGGKGTITRMFERDEERTLHTKAPRRIAGAIFTGPGITGDRPWPEYDFRPFRFHFIGGAGESFSMPFYSHSRGESRAVLLEAIPDGPLDQAGEVDSPEGMRTYVLEMIKTFMPEDFEHFADAQVVDDKAWLRGAFVPQVRRPVAITASGRPVLGLGDTLILNDPAGGQGANSATRMVRHYLAAIEKDRDSGYGADWMQATFDDFWAASGKDTTDYTNALLAEPSPELMSILGAAAGDFGVGSAFAQSLDQPWTLQRATASAEAAAAFIGAHRTEPAIA